MPEEAVRSPLIIIVAVLAVFIIIFVFVMQMFFGVNILQFVCKVVGAFIALALNLPGVLGGVSESSLTAGCNLL